MNVLDKKIEIDKSNWQPIKFGDVVFEPKESTKDPIEDNIEHVVGLEHITSDDIHLRNSNSIEESTTFTKKFDIDDVLFGRRRAYLKKAAQAKFGGICSGDITVFRAKDNLLPELLPFIVHNDKFFDYAIKHSAGGLSPRVKFKDLANYEFLLPPKDQQAKLAELLWTMDAVIERENTTLNKNEELFLSFSKSIFFKGIGKQMKLKDVGDLIMGQSPPGKTYNKEGNGMPFLQGNAEFGKKRPTHVQYTSAPNRTVQEKTILISVRAPVGDLNIADREYCIGRGLAGLYIESENLRNYVHNFLKYARFELEKNSTGSTFKAINKDTLSSLKLIIPEKKVLEDNSKKLSSIIEATELFSSKISSSKALQKSLINQVF
jgi:type I restriction enzyme S subunit